MAIFDGFLNSCVHNLNFLREISKAIENFAFFEIREQEFLTNKLDTYRKCELKKIGS